MRSVLLWIIGVFSVLTVWHTYAPAHQKDALPPAASAALAGLEDRFGRGVERTSTLFGDLVAQQLKASAASQNVASPLTVIPQDGIPRVYEDLSLEELLQQNIDPTAYIHAKPGQLPSAASRVDGRGLSFVGMDLKGLAARGADLHGAVFHRADLDQANFAQANLQDTVFVRSPLTQANLSGAVLLNGTMRHNSADHSDLTKARLSGLRVLHTSFVGAQFDGSTLHDATFIGADLRQTSWRGADLSGADLHLSTGLTASTLSGACGDQRTQLPAGLSLPPCGPMELASAAFGMTAN